MKIAGVDVFDAFARGFGIAFKPALIASLVGYIVKTGWIEAPLDWALWPMLRDMVSKSITVTLLVSIIVGLLVFVWRLMMRAVVWQAEKEAREDQSSQSGAAIARSEESNRALQPKS
jgi:hypothetical protein